MIKFVVRNFDYQSLLFYKIENHKKVTNDKSFVTPKTIKY